MRIKKKPMILSPSIPHNEGDSMLDETFVVEEQAAANKAVINMCELDVVYFPYKIQSSVSRESYCQARKTLLHALKRERQAKFDSTYLLRRRKLLDIYSEKCKKAERDRKESKTTKDNGSNNSSSNISNGSGSNNSMNTSSKARPVFAFDGIHHIFAEAVGEPVLVCEFCYDRPNMFAFAVNNVIMISQHCDLAPEVDCILRGHQQPITSLDWARGGQYIISSANDKMCIMWDCSSGKCLRSIQCHSLPHCVRFSPLNPNTCVVGCSDGKAVLMNLSTGKITQTLDPTNVSTRMSSSFGLNRRKNVTNNSYQFASITQLIFCDTGRNLFVGDSRGHIGTWRFNATTRNFDVSSWMSPGSAIPAAVNSLRFKAMSEPLLLVGGGTHIAIASLVNETLKIHGSTTIANGWTGCTAEFCPDVLGTSTAYIVTGDLFGCVHFITTAANKFHSCDTLQGHSASIQALCWNSTGSLLASADSNGTVILWRRGQNYQSWNPCLLRSVDKK